MSYIQLYMSNSFMIKCKLLLPDKYFYQIYQTKFTFFIAQLLQDLQTEHKKIVRVLKLEFAMQLIQ